jgi:hypothetical protein
MRRFTHFRTARISPVLSMRLKQYAREREIGESTVLRIALQEFFVRHKNANQILNSGTEVQERAPRAKRKQKSSRSIAKRRSLRCRPYHHLDPIET